MSSMGYGNRSGAGGRKKKDPALTVKGADAQERHRATSKCGGRAGESYIRNEWKLNVDIFQPEEAEC